MVHCLIVNSDNAEREHLRALFAPYCSGIAEASDGASGLDHCRRRMPELIVLDTSVPDMQPVEFVQRLQWLRNPAHAKVFIYAKNLDATSISKLIWEGAAECLMKPLDADLLRFKLAQFGLTRSGKAA